jgi:hypothetical protein
MVKRKRDAGKKHNNVPMSIADLEQDSQINDEFSDIFNKLTFKDIEEVNDIDSLISHFTKKIHISAIHSNIPDNRSIDLRQELLHIRRLLHDRYQSIELANWASSVIIEEIKKDLKKKEHEQFIEDFAKDLENDW